MRVEEWLGSNNQLGVDIWNKKYRYNNETFDQWLERVSNGNEEVRKLILEKKFLFGGRILSNRGLSKYGVKTTLSNCYVIAPPEDNIESIFECASRLARTFSYGGGCGVDISKLSPRGAKVNNTAKETSGAVSFMDLYSLVTGLIGQNGRRGALMLSIDCNHPDLEEFIEIKSDLDRVTKANISIKITDDFMKAVKNKQKYKLSFTRVETEETITKEVDAYEIFNKICVMNWDFAEPGMLYWDNISNWNLLSEYDNFEYAGVNPCFTGDMKLLTAEGYKTFEELDGKDIKLINKDGGISNGKVWCSGEKDIYEIKFASKQKIKCTNNHVFMLNDGTECQAKDLKKKRIMPYLENSNIFDEDFVKYGFIQGDGCLGRLASEEHLGLEVNIGKNDGDIADLFGIYLKENERKVYLNGFNQDLIALGFSSEPLPTREFPTTYNLWTQHQQISFLRGCYSANGSVLKRDGRITYKTTCKEFAEQLKLTLDNMGFRSYITTNKKHNVTFKNGTYECKESYDINIKQYQSRLKFYNEIGFVQQYKMNKLKDNLIKTSPLVYNVIDLHKKEKVYDFNEPITHWGVVEGFIAHNCAEEPLPAGGSCLLGSINLAEFVTENKEFDFDSFNKTVKISTKALNEVLDEGLELHPLQEQRDSVRDWRQIGLGIFGLADMLIKLGIRYGSGESIDLCNLIGFAMIDTAIRTSSELAKEYGTFPKYSHVDTAASDFYISNTTSKTKEMVHKYGLRNSQLLTIAPTGSLSSMLGVSGGIEPIYANFYERTTQSLHGHEEKYKIYTPIVQKYIDENNIKDDTQLPDYFITAQTLNYKERINMQSVWQNYIDASISSTVNVPNDFTIKDTEDLYLYAWEKGLKGITIFRDGCKRLGILTTNTDKKEDNEEITNEKTSYNELPRGYIIQADDNVIGKKRTLTTGCGTLHCSAFFDPINGELLETYFSKGSTGGCNNFMVGLSRMISLSARAGVDIYTIIDQLNSCGNCPSYAVRTATKRDTSKGSCCPVALGNVLLDMYNEIQSDLNEDFEYKKPVKKEIKQSKEIVVKEKVIKNPCPQCGEELRFEGGCNFCPNCSYSKCD